MGEKDPEGEKWVLTISEKLETTNYKLLFSVAISLSLSRIELLKRHDPISTLTEWETCKLTGAYDGMAQNHLNSTFYLQLVCSNVGLVWLPRTHVHLVRHSRSQRLWLFGKFSCMVLRDPDNSDFVLFSNVKWKKRKGIYIGGLHRGALRHSRAEHEDEKMIATISLRSCSSNLCTWLRFAWRRNKNLVRIFWRVKARSSTSDHKNGYEVHVMSRERNTEAHVVSNRCWYLRWVM